MRRWKRVSLLAILMLGGSLPASGQCSDSLGRSGSVTQSPRSGDTVETREYVATTFEAPGARRPVVLLDHRGRVVLAVAIGDSIQVRRYARPGQLDGSFGTGGILSLRAGRPGVAALLEGSDGRLVVVASEVIEDRTEGALDFGWAVTLRALRPDGRAEPGFGLDGKAVLTCGSRKAGSRALAATVAEDDSIYVLCSSPPLLAALRVPASGSTGPGGAAVVVSTLAAAQTSGSLWLGKQGSLVVAAQTESQLVVMRATPGASSTQTFSRKGTCAPPPLILPDGDVGTIECTGRSVTIVRYGPDAQPSGIVLANLALPAGVITAAQSDPLGRIVLGGSTVDGAGGRLFLARYGSDGVADRTFGSNGVIALHADDGTALLSLAADTQAIVASLASVRSASVDRIITLWSPR